MLFGDAQLLTQAINNLLSDAIKYSPATSEVEIGSASRDSKVSIYICDEGYGIPKEAQVTLRTREIASHRTIQICSGAI